MAVTQLPPRTGQQYTIAFGDYTAVITQQGAGLRRLTWQGKDVVVPFGADDVPTCMRGQVLVPFPNRIEGGEYTFEGKTYELPIDEHERNNAIHGYGYRHLWALERLTTSAVTLCWRTPNLTGYPFDVLVHVAYELDEDGLHVQVHAENHGGEDAPWAVAIHPWIANGGDAYGDAIDEINAQCTLELPARTHVTINQNLIPTGTEPVDGTAYDYREPKALSAQPIDDAWTDLEHDAGGTVTAVFTRIDGIRVRVTGDESITSYQVCDASGFPEPIHPCGVAIEPQTAYANAFNTGIDLITIAPSESSTTNMLIGVVR